MTGPPSAAEARDEAVEPLGAPTDPLRPTGRMAEGGIPVRGGGRPARMPWPGRGTRRVLVGLLVALALVILVAILLGSVPSPGG